MENPYEPLDTRLEIRISTNELDRLRNLKTRTEARSFAEVVRNALKVYESSLNKKKA